MSLRLPELGADPASGFPPVESALAQPDGLLAFGGDLAPARLLDAYRNGIFPWFSAGEPILWWSPSRRAVFRTDNVHLSSRFRRSLRSSQLIVRADTAFDAVIQACARHPRPGQAGGTWITDDMIAAYRRLHRLGHAHSVEVYEGDALVGGLYGLAVGRLFCGESMFSVRSGASSIALAALADRLHAWGWPCIDAQVPNAHTRRLGVETWPRPDFMHALHALRDVPESPGEWTLRFGDVPAPTLSDRAPA